MIWSMEPSGYLRWQQRTNAPARDGVWSRSWPADDRPGVVVAAVVVVVGAPVAARRRGEVSCAGSKHSVSGVAACRGVRRVQTPY